MKKFSLGPKGKFKSVLLSLLLTSALAVTLVSSGFTVSKPYKTNAHLLRVERKGFAVLYYFRINIPGGYVDVSGKGAPSSGTISFFVGAMQSGSYANNGTATGNYTSDGNGNFNINVTYTITGWGTSGYNGSPAIVSNGPIGAE